MVKMSIITAEPSTIEVNGRPKPCIILVGRGEDLKRLKRRIPFYPYFYLTEQDYKDLNEAGFFEKMHVISVEPASHRNIMKRLMTKITVEDAGRIGDNIQMVNKASKLKTLGFDALSERRVYTFEADLGKAELLPLRWMIDNGIKSGVDITEVGGKTVYTPIDFSVSLRKWFLDFEAYTLREWSTGMNGDEPLIMISIKDSYEKKMYTLYAVNPNWSPAQLIAARRYFADRVKRSEFPHEVLEYADEAKFLDGLMGLKIKLDPDVMIAWNLNRYDLPKWKQRCEKNSGKLIYDFREISPLKSIFAHSKPLRVKGLVLFDLMVAFKQFTDQELDSYALAFVTEKEKLGVKKIEFAGNSGKTWDTRPDIMIDRNIADVLIMEALDEKYGLVETYDEARKEFGCLFHESFVRNRVIDSALLRMVNDKVILSTPHYGQETGEKLKGAIVIEPVVGDNYWVAGLDLSRDYPSIIKGMNISPETYREKKPKEPHYTLEYTIHDDVLGDRVFKAYFLKSPIGLLPQLILRFDAMRSYYQKEMAKAIANHEPEYIIRKWERRQYNIKKTTNAIYGVMDYAGFRLMRKECTQSVAVMGRITIEEMVRYLEELGYKMLYGDTDSTFVKLHASTPEECLKEGQELQAKINAHLTKFFKEKYGMDAHAELGLKSIYKKIKFFAKKTYAGLVVWDEKKGWIAADSPDRLDIKGVSAVRSDASQVEKEAIKQVITFDLDEMGTEVIQDFIDALLGDFDRRAFTPMQVAYPAQIKERLYYDAKKQGWVSESAKLDKNGRVSFPSHARAVIYTNMVCNTDFHEGDKPKRLPIKFPKEHIGKGQVTLFGMKKIICPYPQEWVYKGKTGGIKTDITVKAKDISIVEDFAIPQYFAEHIDWDRIRKRLVQKLNKLLTHDNSNDESIEEE